MKYENYDLYFPDQPVVDLYLPTWANLPAFRSKPAFIWVDDGPARSLGPSTLTYEQMNISVQSISSHLSHSLQRGDTVAILCGPGLELVEIIFACQRAGLRAVPVSPPHPSFANGNHHHLVRALSQTKPKAALARQSYINSVRDYYIRKPSSLGNNYLSELLNTIKWIATEDLKDLKSDGREQSTISSPPRYNGCRENDIYLIQYTSGATGIPKPVLVTAGAAAHNVRVARKAYDLHPNSIIVSWLPQYHDCGLMFLLLTVVSGATCVLTCPNTFVNRPRIWLEMISDYGATCTPVPSFALPLVVRRGGVDDKGTATSPITLRTMKNLIIINEPIHKTSIDEFVDVFRPFGLNPSSISPSYGLAENCTFVSTAWRSDKNDNFPIHNNLLPSAKLQEADQVTGDQEDIEILIVNEETHEPINDGIEGEIWISSPSNANGYLGHPSLTREVFNARLRNKVAGCFVRTGDRGIVVGKERYLYVTGRALDIIKRADGREIHPHYIETSAYNSCPKMLRAGCLAAFELSSGDIAVVAELGKEVEPKALIMSICEGIRNAVMDEERVEVRIVVLVKSRSVPKTTSGKVQRWAAKDGLERGLLDVVMKMEFGVDGSNSALFGAMKCEEMERKVKAGEEREEMVLAKTSTKNHLSLHSSL